MVSGVVRRYGSRLLFAGLCGLLLAGLWGCERRHTAQELLEEKLHPIKVEGLAEALKATPPASPQPSPKLSDSIADDSSSDTPARVAPEGDIKAGGDDPYMKDYVAFADVYWKLNWIRKELLRGNVPYNLLEEMDTAEKKLQLTVRDGNYDRATEALARLKKGLEHLACLRVIQAAHIDDRSVPWGAGAPAVQQYVENVLAGARVTPAHPSPISRLLEDDSELRSKQYDLPSASTVSYIPILPLILDYEARYQASPRELIRREWEQAIRLTNRLRDQLYLANRPENNDGDSADVSVAVDQAISAASLATPDGAGRTGLAPDPVASH